MLRYMTYEMALSFTGVAAIILTSVISGRKSETVLVEKDETPIPTAMSLPREKIRVPDTTDRDNKRSHGWRGRKPNYGYTKGGQHRTSRAW